MWISNPPVTPVVDCNPLFSGSLAHLTFSVLMWLYRTPGSKVISAGLSSRMMKPSGCMTHLIHCTHAWCVLPKDLLLHCRLLTRADCELSAFSDLTSSAINRVDATPTIVWFWIPRYRYELRLCVSTSWLVRTCSQSSNPILWCNSSV